MRKALIVPGAAVRRYVRDAVEALPTVGISGELLAAPGEPKVPADLGEYGRDLAGRITGGGGVEVLIGLSVGAQVAAVAAAVTARASRRGSVGRLVLISPTVDPAARSAPRLVGRWLADGCVEPVSLLPQQLPDWRRAGLARIATVVRSARRIAIERLLPGVSCPVTVVHAERDVITFHAYAAHLAAVADGDLVIVPGAAHSLAPRRPRTLRCLDRLADPVNAPPRRGKTLRPQKVVASVDSASVLHAALVALRRPPPAPRIASTPARGRHSATLRCGHPAATTCRLGGVIHEYMQIA